MTLELKPHPTTPCGAIDRIEVEISRLGDRLILYFTLFGDIGAIRGLPGSDAQETRLDGVRRDELWRSTCFECFIAPDNDPSYVELNIAPSGDWAAYGFTGYRAGMANASASVTSVSGYARAGIFNLGAFVDLDGSVPVATSLRCALSAVIQTTSGATSYWALAHPDGKPDFHHADSFQHRLAPWGTS